MGFTNPTPLKVVGPITAKLTTPVTGTVTVTKITTPTAVETAGAGGLVVTGDRAEYLGEITWSSGSHIAKTFTGLDHAYSALYVVTTCSPRTALCVVVTPKTSLGATWFSLTCAPCTLRPLSSSGSYAGVVPTGNVGGGQLDVIVYLDGTGDATTKAYVYGLTSNPGVLLRSDGRTHPIGAHAAQAQLTTATTKALLSPATPLRLLVKSAFVTGLASGNAGIVGTIDGTGSATLLRAYGATSVAHEWPDGVLFDPGEPVYLYSTAAVQCYGGILADFVV